MKVIIIIAILALVAIAANAQSPNGKPTPAANTPAPTAPATAKAPTVAMTDKEWAELEPLLRQSAIKNQELNAAIADLRSIDVKPRESGGDARMAVKLWQDAMKLKDEADAAAQALFDRVAAAHDCRGCGLDTQKRLLLRPPEAKKEQ